MGLDRLLSLVRIESSGPVFNPRTSTEVEYGRVWGEYRLQTLEERAGGVVADATQVIRVRWRSDIAVGNRVTIEGVEYQIMGINEVGRRRWLDLSHRGIKGRSMRIWPFNREARAQGLSDRIIQYALSQAQGNTATAEASAVGGA